MSDPYLIRYLRRDGTTILLTTMQCEDMGKAVQLARETMKDEYAIVEISIAHDLDTPTVVRA